MSDRLGLLSVLSVALLYGHAYVNPARTGTPAGLDLGFATAYLGVFRQQLLEHGRLLTWYSVAFHGMPLLGHPLVGVFYVPLMLPILALGTEAGLRCVYVTTLFLTGCTTYALARQVGARPLVAAWAGGLFLLSGTVGARLYAGHLEKVLALSLTPLVFACALRAAHGGGSLWAVAAGLSHGLIFLAGDSYLLLYLCAAVPLILLLASLYAGNGRIDGSLLRPLAAWAGGLLLSTSGKLVASLGVLRGSSRDVEPFQGSQDWYWAFWHLVYPFSAHGWTLPGRALPLLSTFGKVPGPSGNGWWEYCQYIGVLPALLAAVPVLGVIGRRWFRHVRPLDRPDRDGDVIALLGICALASLWLANAAWYSPVHWLYLMVPPLQQFRVPSRALMVMTPAMVALASMGLEMAMRHAEARDRRLQAISALLAATALVDVYLVTHWIPTVRESPDGPSVRAAIDEITRSQPGPFVVDVRGFGFADDSAIIQILADRGVRVASYLAPLTPTAASEHSVVAPSTHVRYTLERDTSVQGVPTLSARAPGTWQDDFTVGTVAVKVNLLAAAGAWLVQGNRVLHVPIEQAGPMRFVVGGSSWASGMLVIPANAFPGWYISVDGGTAHRASELDGFVAAAVEPGRHEYTFSYRQPGLVPILVLAALAWAVTLVVLLRCMASLGRDARCRRRPVALGS